MIYITTSVGQIGLDLVVNENGFKSQMNGILGLAKKAGTAMAAAFGVKKLVDFGKQCLELGSDLAEVQNVVDVTFPTMSAQVDKFAKSAAQSFGLSETMAKQYTGTFGAMAKAFGFTESQAYNMSSTLTKLTGDVASFYNLSQDEAYTKLKSVFTGETESLKDLGVVMTQTALDSYAMANGFGKTTSAMSEAEKVALRYQFVQDQLSAAQGDFARTSDSWANQVRILTLQFDSLKATIGQGLINLFTPIIKVINTVIGKLATLANAFKSFTELITGQKSSAESSGVAAVASAATDAGDSLSGASDSASNLTSNTNKAGKAAENAAKKMKSLMGFDKINKVDSNNTSTGSSGSGSTGSGSGAGGLLGNTVDFGGLAQGETVLDKTDKKFTEMFQNIKKLCDPATKSLKRLWNEGLARLGKFTFNSLKDFWNNFLVPVGKWTLGTGFPRFIDALNNGLMKVNFDKMQSSLNGLWKALAPFAIHVGEGLLWFWENVLVPLGTWTANEVIPRFLETLSGAINVFNGILTALQPLFQWFWDSVLQPIAQWTGGVFCVLWDKINGVLKTFSDWCVANPGVIQTIATVIASFFAAWKITEFVTGAAELITTIFNVVGSIKSIAGAASLVKTGIEALVGALGGPLVIGIAAAITAGVLLYENWDTICEYATKLKEWVVEKAQALKESVVKAFNTLKTSVKNATEALGESIREKWDWIQKKLSSFSKWLGTVFKTAWDNGFGALKTILDSFSTNVSNCWSNIKKVFNGIVTFIDGVFSADWKKAWEGIKDVFSGVFSGIVDIAKVPLNAVIGAFNGIISIVNSLIGEINGLHFRITVPDWVPGVGGKWWGFNGFSIPTIGTVPMLANGAYVRANTPQLAMIGDNRHQGEFVAPEDKLQEMALQAASMAGGGISKVDLEALLNRAVMRIVAALAQMGFYMDSKQVATAVRNAMAADDVRHNTVEVM